jgi:ribonuclease HI
MKFIFQCQRSAGWRRVASDPALRQRWRAICFLCLFARCRAERLVIMTTQTTTAKHVIAYTDGAASNNQNAELRVGGYGAILMLVNEHGQRDERPAAYKELSGKLPGATNNQAELEAVKQVLLALKRENTTITIHTDSDYVIGVLARNWKPKQNQALIAEVKALLAKHVVTFQKVAGHSGDEYNTRADTLAVTATKS